MSTLTSSGFEGQQVAELTAALHASERADAELVGAVAAALPMLRKLRVTPGMAHLIARAEAADAAIDALIAAQAALA